LLIIRVGDSLVRMLFGQLKHGVLLYVDTKI